MAGINQNMKIRLRSKKVDPSGLGAQTLMRKMYVKNEKKNQYLIINYALKKIMKTIHFLIATIIRFITTCSAFWERFLDKQMTTTHLALNFF